MLRWDDDSELNLYRATGCHHCDNLGYKGRIAIVEVLRINNELNEMIAHRAPETEIAIAAKNNGYKPLSVDGISRVISGQTSIEEVARVVDLTRENYER